MDVAVEAQAASRTHTAGHMQKYPDGLHRINSDGQVVGMLVRATYKGGGGMLMCIGMARYTMYRYGRC